jgi:hypothetical protein
VRAIEWRASERDEFCQRIELIGDEQTGKKREGQLVAWYLKVRVRQESSPSTTLPSPCKQLRATLDKRREGVGGHHRRAATWQLLSEATAHGRQSHFYPLVLLILQRNMMINFNKSC